MDVQLSPLKAIRHKCLECAGTINEVTHCHIVDCPLWAFRFGTNPRTVLKNKPHRLDPAKVRESHIRSLVAIGTSKEDAEVMTPKAGCTFEEVESAIKKADEGRSVWKGKNG